MQRQVVREVFLKTITANEEDIEKIFSVKGKLLDKNMQWPYNDYLYDIEQDDLGLSFSIQPAFGDVRVKLEYRNNVLCDLNFKEVEDVVAMEDDAGPYLLIKVTDTDSLTVRRTPSILVEFGSTEDLYFF